MTFGKDSIFNGHQLFNRALITPSSPGKLRFWYGFGILGIVLMDYNIQVTRNVIVDLRFVAMMVAALYGGFFSAVVSTSLMLVGRVLLYNCSIVAIISILRFPNWKRIYCYKDRIIAPSCGKIVQDPYRRQQSASDTVTMR